MLCLTLLCFMPMLCLTFLCFMPCHFGVRQNTVDEYGNSVQSLLRKLMPSHEYNIAHVESRVQIPSLFKNKMNLISKTDSRIHMIDMTEKTR